jgi:metal-sulfur cluster biosynthetic enzyme
MPSKEEVVEALRQVEDPELGMDIVELGLFYEAEIDGPNVAVQYTLTSMGCPAGQMIQEDIERVVGEIPGVGEVTTDLTRLSHRGRPTACPTMRSSFSASAEPLRASRLFDRARLWRRESATRSPSAELSSRFHSEEPDRHAGHSCIAAQSVALVTLTPHVDRLVHEGLNGCGARRGGGARSGDDLERPARASERRSRSS